MRQSNFFPLQKLFFYSWPCFAERKNIRPQKAKGREFPRTVWPEYPQWMTKINPFIESIYSSDRPTLAEPWYDKCSMDLNAYSALREAIRIIRPGSKRVFPYMKDSVLHAPSRCSGLPLAHLYPRPMQQGRHLSCAILCYIESPLFSLLPVLNVGCVMVC